ncbi:hypothetical protein HYX70_02605 [Candidatus Saccharibacteria bacterium]|nr:hypothetical protein [Candidatus Saccharibacteria bacterium]
MSPNKKSVDGMIVRSAQPKTPAKKPVPTKTQPPKQPVDTKPAAQNSVQLKSEPANPNQPPLTGWSWGAFLLNWIWGIGNHVWIALLVLIPIAPINLILAIYLGLKGNELAWRARQWESPEKFIEAQRQWAKWGVVILILGVVVVLASIALVALLASSTTTGY